MKSRTHGSRNSSSHSSNEALKVLETVVRLNEKSDSWEPELRSLLPGIECAHRGKHHGRPTRQEHAVATPRSAATVHLSNSPTAAQIRLGSDSLYWNTSARQCFLLNTQVPFTE